MLSAPRSRFFLEKICSKYFDWDLRALLAGQRWSVDTIRVLIAGLPQPDLLLPAILA
jgi:hypothetical protein